MAPRSCPFVILVLLAWAGTATAAERYYCLVFGSQRTPNEPRYSHSFGLFIKVTEEGGLCTLETRGISWLPATLEVRPAALCPEAGVNLLIDDTIRYALQSRERISVWGPYEIKKELYCRALKQADYLESGCMKYKAVDTGYPSKVASNCIHALATIAEGLPIMAPTFTWGETASFFIVQRFEPWIIDRGSYHDWLIVALRLDQYPLIWRQHEPPRSGGIRTAFRTVSGREEQIRRRQTSP
jgi:hypothetical protein